MKRTASRQLPQLITEIQLTPLLDLVLVLLLSAVVLLPLLSAGKTDPAEPPRPTRVLDLVVKPDFKITLDGQVIQDNELIKALKMRLSLAPDTGVLVHVPPALQTPALLEIMDALRQASVRHTSVVVDGPSDPP